MDMDGIAWCHQATTNYLSQFRSKSLLPYDLTCLQSVKVISDGTLVDKLMLLNHISMLLNHISSMLNHISSMLNHISSMLLNHISSMPCCRIWSWSPMLCEKHGPRDLVDINRGWRPRFLSLLRPEGRVFHTAWETMIKSYYSTLADWFFFSFCLQKCEF